jgi:hypothetical protein
MALLFVVIMITKGAAVFGKDLLKTLVVAREVVICHHFAT